MASVHKEGILHPGGPVGRLRGKPFASLGAALGHVRSGGRVARHEDAEAFGADE